MTKRRRFLTIYLIVGLLWCIGREINVNVRHAPFSLVTIVAKDVTLGQRMFVLGWGLIFPVFAWPLDMLLLASVSPPLFQE